MSKKNIILILIIIFGVGGLIGYMVSQNEEEVATDTNEEKVIPDFGEQVGPIEIGEAVTLDYYLEEETFSDTSIEMTDKKVEDFLNSNIYDKEMVNMISYIYGVQHIETVFYNLVKKAFLENEYTMDENNFVFEVSKLLEYGKELYGMKTLEITEAEFDGYTYNASNGTVSSTLENGVIPSNDGTDYNLVSSLNSYEITGNKITADFNIKLNYVEAEYQEYNTDLDYQIELIYLDGEFMILSVNL